MPNSQYGNLLFIDNFAAGGSTKSLRRISLESYGVGSAPYDEAWLQGLVMSHPHLLPISQVEPSFRDLVPVCRELRTAAGFLDNLLVTPTGDIALVECKLWRNPQARREVIAQIIDYAKEISTWNYEQLEEAIRRTKPSYGANEPRESSLYGFVAKRGEAEEASFIDAVSRNLRRGRFLLLVVGDGIREGMESITEYLQQFAGLRFTLALVELVLYEGPDAGCIVQPRLLAKTTNIERGVVTISEGGRISISPGVQKMAGKVPDAKTTISKEHYCEQLEVNFPGITPFLNAFLDKLDDYQVSSEFRIHSMILRWESEIKGWNVGTVQTSGRVMIDQLCYQAEDVGMVKLSTAYLRKMAALVSGAHVMETPKASGWYVKNLRIDALLSDEAQQLAWINAITEFQEAVRNEPVSN